MSDITSKIISNNFANIVYNNQLYTISSQNPNFKKALKALAEEKYEKFISLCSKLEAVKKFCSFSSGKFRVEQNHVFYDGKPLNNVITSRILDHIKDNISPMYLVKFLDKLYKNPSKRAVDEGYNFLEALNFTITQDGDVIAYKNVRKTYFDWHSNSFDNTPGNTLEMSRNLVDDDKDKTCSSGFHVADITYARNFYSESNSRVVLCKFSPEDIVSVPSDHNSKKLRVCKYTVLSEYGSDEAIKAPVVSSTGSSLKPTRDSMGRFLPK